MKIAFYSPLKAPDHPTPSGDRLMARLLMAALERAGHQVDIASRLRSFSSDPASPAYEEAATAALREAERLAAAWRKDGKPDLWFCYHPYYKAPDLIGPALCEAFDVPSVTAEASYSARRNRGTWARSQQMVVDSVKRAAVNICFTRRDHAGLADAVPGARLALLKPFIDPSAFLALLPEPAPFQLIAVAMMRAGDKMDSYVMLAEALARLEQLAWTLSIVGDGPMNADVRALFARFGQGRVEWHGERTTGEIARLLARSTLYVWPGCGEAYGLAYLEAQAAGVPVVAQEIAGVPEVVEPGVTGLLTPAGDIAAYAEAVERLLTDDGLRQAMATAARRFVADERSLDRAGQVLDAILKANPDIRQ